MLLSRRTMNILLSRRTTTTVTNKIIRLSSTSSFSSTAAVEDPQSAGILNIWKEYEMGPPDAIIGLNEAYEKDPSPFKINVGVGAYRDDDGYPYILPCVKEAERRIHTIQQNTTEDRIPPLQFNHEYLPIGGDDEFIRCALQFIYGEEVIDYEDRIAAVQTLSGTGGLRIFGEFIQQQQEHAPLLYVPTPTWGNHKAIFENAGFSNVHSYRYYDTTKSELAFESLIQDFHSMPSGSIVLLHACAHNPTGMDPSMDQWEEISMLMKERRLLPFFDCAYQGFASGDADRDASAVRLFLEDGHLLATVQSFSKNFGLYGQRVGCLSIVCNSSEEAACVESQLKRTIRPMYSNPPKYGSNVVKTILNDSELKQNFHKECSDMAQRIHTMRYKLRSALEEDSDRNWQHITKQIGMFAYSGLSPEQVTKLRNDHSIYCTLDGRISLAGVTSHNVDYLANAIHQVI